MSDARKLAVALDDGKTYRILRIYAPSLERDSEVVDTGLTLAEAQAHCNDTSTREDGKWFDAYEREES